MSDEISLEDRGLDLILGGGLRRVRRSGDKSGTVLLIRGPAGSGKTLVGFHAALALARGSRAPIAYACIELLPTELDAQIRSQRPDLADRVVIHHREARAEGPTHAGMVIVEARILDLSEGPDALGEGVARIREALAKIGPAPGVFVIDSLIDGYGVGSSASREFADAVCKLAAHWGVALVLLEECAPGTTSPWVYAADTVLELGVTTDDVDASRPAPFERRMTVLKHRFGPSDAGPHRFLLDPGAPPQVLPRPSAWLESWTAALAAGIPITLRRHEAGVMLSSGSKSIPAKFPGRPIVAVFGSIARRVFEVARGLEPISEGGVDLNVSFTLPLGERSRARLPDGERLVGLAHPYLSPHRMLRALLEEVDSVGTPRRVLIADLRAVRSFWNPDGLRRAIGVFCQLMRRLGVPVILVESTASRKTLTGTANGAIEFTQAGLDVPGIVDFADLSIEVVTDGNVPLRELAIITDLRDGATQRINLIPPPDVTAR